MRHISFSDNGRRAPVPVWIIVFIAFASFICWMAVIGICDTGESLIQKIQSVIGG